MFIGDAVLYTLPVVVSFRFGLGFSGREKFGISVVIVTSMLYLFALAMIGYYVYVIAPASPEVTSARDALIHNVVMPTVEFILTFLLLPALIAYATARVIGSGRMSPNASLERTHVE